MKILHICRYVWRMISVTVRWGRYPRDFVCDPERKLVYLSNPKVACSSIKVSMFGGKPDIHAYTRPCKKTDLTPEMENYYKFSFVRNPYERLVSCYEDKCVKQFRFWDFYFFGYLSDVTDFTDFVKRISKIPDCIAEPHFAGQYRLTHDRRGRCLVDYIGKVESLKEEFVPISERFGLLPLPHTNRVASLVDKKWMDYYTLETAELVYRKYKRDFVTFGYTDEYKMLKDYLKKKK